MEPVMIRNTHKLNTPCYILDEKSLKHNLEILAAVERNTGCRILLAQKAFSCFCEYPLIGKYISGTTASGLYEAKLGKEEMGKENHVFSPAYRDQDIDELSVICDHIIFNSPSQVQKYAKRALETNEAARFSASFTNSNDSSNIPALSLGLRINPECSTQKDHAIYDPCSKGSRLGTTLSYFEAFFDEPIMRLISGLHFHTLCEQNSDDLITTLSVVEQNFGKYLALPQIKWLNMGGGHHITRDDYDIPALEKAITRIKEKYNIQIYLEPGEAVVLNSGYFVTRVLEKVSNSGIQNLILDGSAACHMPDVIEMLYRPPLFESGEPDEKRYTYRLTGNTCLAGDIIGDYSFDNEIQIGDTLIFEDMALYTIVKNNTFNGIPLPDIYRLNEDDSYELIKQFGYDDFKSRLS